MKKACIFDFDGTLVYTGDEMHWYGTAALREMGMDAIDVKYYTDHSGEDHEHFFRGVIADSYGEETADRCWKEFFERYEHLLATDKRGNELAKPYPGMEDMIRALKKKGYLLAVYSNKHQSSCDTIVRKHFGDLFDVIQGNDGTFLPKPDPEGGRRIMEKLRVKPEECYYFGDSGIDMETGDNVGFTKVAVLWGYREKKDFIPYRPDYILEKPEDILHLPE